MYDTKENRAWQGAARSEVLTCRPYSASTPGCKPESRGRAFVTDALAPEVAVRFDRLTKLLAPRFPDSTKFGWELHVDDVPIRFNTEELVGGPAHAQFCAKVLEWAGWLPPEVSADDWRVLVNELNSKQRVRPVYEDDLP